MTARARGVHISELLRSKTCNFVEWNAACFSLALLSAHTRKRVVKASLPRMHARKRKPNKLQTHTIISSLSHFEIPTSTAVQEILLLDAR